MIGLFWLAGRWAKNKHQLSWSPPVSTEQGGPTKKQQTDEF
jgi:hypothetical protein